MALLWLIAAWICARRERDLLAGALAGFAVGAKSFALLAVPFLVWRRPGLILSAFFAALGLIDGPILSSGSSAEWPGVQAMAGYFEFNSFGFAVLASWFGSAVARLLWPVLFACVAALLFARWARAGRALEEAPMADVFLAFFLLSPVLNPWYVVWLVPFVAVATRRRAVRCLR